MSVTHVVSIQAIWYRYRYPKSIASDPLYKHISNLLSVNQAIFMSIHMRCSSYILFLLACVYAVPVLYISKSQKEAKSQCVSPKGEKLFEHF